MIARSDTVLCNLSSFSRMALSGFALTLGVLLYLIGLPLIFTEFEAVAFRRRFLKDEMALRIVGALLIILAVTTLRRQWKITDDLEGLMVFVVWLTFLKGIITAWWPKQCATLTTSILDGKFHAPVWQVSLGVIMVLLAAGFTWLGIMLV